MGTISLSIKSEKQTKDLFSVEELKERFLFGLNIESQGKPMPDRTYMEYVQFAKEEIEKLLLVKLDLQIYSEEKNFHYGDWKMWNQIRTSYPVICGLELSGFVGTIKQVTYPKEWLSVRSSQEDLYSRLVHIVPNSAIGYHQSAAVYSGLYPINGVIAGGSHTPNFWTIKYVTGFKKVPKDIETAIGMLAAINIMAVANETLAAAMGVLGSSSKSISIDGLSQSTSMYINGQTGIFGARIKQYTDQLNGVGNQPGLLKRLQDYYGAILWTTG